MISIRSVRSSLLNFARQRFNFVRLLGWLMVLAVPNLSHGEIRVGTAIVDVTPPQFPVLVNGGFFSGTADKVNTPVLARALVVDDGQHRLAIVVVDSCMLPRELIDQVKHIAAKRTGLKADHILMSATHTHTAPSAMGALGTEPDTSYVSFLRENLVQTLVEAEQDLQPARVGYGVTDAAAYTAVRRWIRRTDRVENDPFGNPTVQANMHAATDWDNVTGPSGSEDPDFSLIAFQTLDGKPLAVLANFSMHYFGDAPISADYFGRFCDEIQTRLGGSSGPDADVGDGPVAILSHGCSGDIWRKDYTLPESERADWTITQYTAALVDTAMKAYESIQYETDVDIEMAESRLSLAYRVPDAQRLEWAKKIMQQLGDEPLTTRTQVYAREQIYLDALQRTEVVVQAVRIGNIAIATTPTETYALTGMKIKFQSPLENTMVIELANGGDGYIPPPEQHELGGYNTWPARSAGLEIDAEPKITAAALSLLESVSGKPRRRFDVPLSDDEQAIEKQRPIAFYRMNEFAGPRAADASGNHHDGIYESKIAFFLDGPPSPNAAGPRPSELNRAAHFAGGRLRSNLPELGPDYKVTLWFWNGMPTDARATTGWLFSRDFDNSITPRGDHVGIGGNGTQPGCLIYQHHGETSIGSTPIARWTWNKLTFERQGDQITIRLNDVATPEIRVTAAGPPTVPSLFFGGNSDRASAPFEGRLDQIAIE